jgi:alpha-N-arabinofuranosidase
VLPGEPIATIAPDIYGHFAEHIGVVVYDGIWVGKKSKIPNMGGIRTALVEHMRRLHAPVIRWPGGCFADSYNWRDGIGPREKRPRRANFWMNDSFLMRAPDGPQKYEPNEFGTNEFARFCRQCGSQPYFAANVRSLTPRDFYEWVEYSNTPAGSTTLASERGGEPFQVRYWGIGNESWGCGGNFTPEEYAVEYRKFVTWVPEFGARPASSPPGRMAAISTGPAASSRNCSRKAAACWAQSTASRCTTTAGRRAKARPSTSPWMTGTNCSTRPTAWKN